MHLYIPAAKCQMQLWTRALILSPGKHTVPPGRDLQLKHLEREVIPKVQCMCK